MDQNQNILYIGKASNLSKRLKSYLNKKTSNKTQRMLALATDVAWDVCKNEENALLTEAFQIKEFQPKYNILLKDDKSFLEICVAINSAFPSIYVERSRSRRSPEPAVKTKRPNPRFGPFARGGIIKTVIDIMQKLFCLRDCRDSVFRLHQNQKRPCLQYHIKRCSGPCAGYISEGDYRRNVEQCIAMLRGDSKEILKEMKAQMTQASDNMEYEKAAMLRDKIAIINEISAPEASYEVFRNCDFITILTNREACCFYATFFRNQKNCGSIDLFTTATNIIDEGEDVITSVILQFYENKAPPETIIINEEIEAAKKKKISKALGIVRGGPVTIRKPTNKQEKNISSTSAINASAAMAKRLNSENAIESILLQIKDVFGLGSIPNRIEVFDNSHLFGTHRVGGMIVADKNGFIKKDYQKFFFKKTDYNASDDYAMMKDMLSQRLTQIKRLDSLIDKTKIPDLLIIDGGKGHKTAILQAMNECDIFIPFACIAKGQDRNAGREVFYTIDKDDFSLGFQTPLLFYLQNLRDEAHRFAITSHRQKKRASVTESELDKIAAIGKSRKALLLSHFGSLEEIKKASVDHICRIKGFSKKIAEQIYWHFRK